jgi:hypothetical protein
VCKCTYGEKKNTDKKRFLPSCAFSKSFLFLIYFAKYIRDVLINACKSSCNKWGYEICPIQLKTEKAWKFFHWLLQCGTSWKCTIVGWRFVTSVRKDWKIDWQWRLI